MKVAINSCYGGFNLSDEVIKLCIEKGMTCSKDDKYYRTHPIIVEAIEELGEKKSSGFCSKIKIVDIPFNSNEGWEIAEYDGKEWIEENHQSWS
jgi:hypothetical protein